MKGSGGPPGAMVLCVLAEGGYPEDASSQEAGRHVHVELERGISTPNRKPSGFFSWIITGQGAVGVGCMLALDLQNHYWEPPALPLSSWPTPLLSFHLPNGYISVYFTAQLPGISDKAQLSVVYLTCI